MTIKFDIISQYQDKGAKQAEKSIARLSKSAKNLAVALGVGFSINKIVQFGKASVAEFEASELAAAKLQNTLKNTGQLLAFPDTLTGLNNLSKLAGVADDVLVPAFQQLYLATGDANKAMESLDLAINVSRGSSNDLNTVVDALSKGYMGNTKGLAALQVGLNKAYLATGDMAGVTQQLNKQFSGASAAYLDTYSGKIQILRNDFENLKQTVGQGLIMAAQAATGNQGIGGVSKAMENLGYFTAAATIKLGYLIDKLNSIPVVGSILDRVVQGWSYLLNVDEVRQELRNQELRQNTKLIEQAYAQADAQKKAAKEYQAFLAKQKKLADAAAKKEAEQAKLKKAANITQMDQIQIMAALQGKISEDDKLRLQLQFALLQDNGTEADKLARKLFESQMLTTDLARAIANLPEALNPFAKWAEYAANAKALFNPRTDAEVAAVNDVVIKNVYGKMDRYEMGYSNAVPTGAGSAGMTVVNNYNINGATPSLLDDLRSGLINDSASGSQSKVNRLSLID